MKKTNVKKTSIDVIEMVFNYQDDKSATIVLNKPSWDITVEAFKYLTDVNDKLDLITPGKLLFDLCVIEHTEGLESNVQLLMSICSQLTTKFILPINATISEEKKNGN